MSYEIYEQQSVTECLVCDPKMSGINSINGVWRPLLKYLFSIALCCEQAGSGKAYPNTGIRDLPQSSARDNSVMADGVMPGDLSSNS